MNAYQNFLDFFSMHNKERLDGLSEGYFTAMTAEERERAFDYLLARVQAGGSEESVHGLFMANAERAVPVVKELLEKKMLRESAEIAAAWNLFRTQPDASLVEVFIKLMSSGDKRVRANAAYYVPAGIVTPDLICALKGMVRTETHTLAAINAANKLLECYGITRDSVDKEQFSRFYRGLRNDDPAEVERTIRQLDRIQLSGSPEMP